MIIITGLVLWLVISSLLIYMDYRRYKHNWEGLKHLWWGDLFINSITGLLISAGILIFSGVTLLFIAPKEVKTVATYDLKAVNEMVTLPKTDSTTYYIAGATLSTSKNIEGVTMLAERKTGLVAIVTTKGNVQINEVEGAKPKVTKLKKYYKKNLATQVFSIAGAEVPIDPTYEATIPVGSQTGKTGVVVSGAED